MMMENVTCSQAQEPTMIPGPGCSLRVVGLSINLALLMGLRITQLFRDIEIKQIGGETP
jgi:hypothetical protein